MKGPVCPFPSHNHPTQSGGNSNSQPPTQQRPPPSSMNQGTQKPKPQTHPTRPPHGPVTQQVTTYPIIPHTHSPQQQTQRPQGKIKWQKIKFVQSTTILSHVYFKERSSIMNMIFFQ